MDFLNLSQECGASVNPATTMAIIKGESGFNPLVIRDNTDKKTYIPETKEEAEKTVNALYLKGHKLAIGLMQVTTPWLDRFNITPHALLDPCQNIRYGTAILTYNYRAFLPISDSKEKALEYALSAYWSGNPYNGGSYINYIYGKAGSPIRVQETPGVSDGILGKSTQKTEKAPAKSESFSGSFFFQKESKDSLFFPR